MSEEYDVAVVGGGIAGCTAATLYGRAGLRVALIESHSKAEAYNKVCTTVIQPSATPTIRRLGLDQMIEEARGVRSRGRVWTRWGILRDETGEPYGYDIRREKLDPMMRAVASRTPGVELMLGHAARSLLTEGRRVVGVGVDRQDGSKREVRARLVVAADGRNSPVAKMAGVKALTIKQHNRFGYFAFYRNVELPSASEPQIWLLEPDVGFAFPQDDGLAILACMLTKDKLPAFRSDLQGSFVSFLKAVPDYPNFDPADQVSKVFGLVDHPNLWRRRPLPGLAFIGDAAVSADPLWGVGCGWAFQSAEWLVDSTTPALDGGGSSLDRAVGTYRKRLRSQLAGHFFLISDYSTGRAYNPVERLMFSASCRDPQLARLALEFGTRSIPVRRFLSPKAIARAISVNLRHRGVQH
ncbi:MAG: NAD(P)/FAD-dependent oxidoreductase, partial [Actinomycetota bacterium]|nr:NAD(P)/FAD-dependent oxidoreductase [Actinomycetota bacterium]